MISKFPDYESTKNLAEKIIMSIDNPVLPIKLKPLIAILTEKDLTVHTYSQYAKTEGIDYDTFISNNRSNDGTLRYFPANNFYILLYNEKMQRDRKTWTLAHELGHYYAGHHLKMMAYLKNHKNIPDKLNTVFEQEANCFAKNLLAPPTLIYSILAALHVSDFISIYTIIRSLFQLSQEASFNIATDMTKVQLTKNCSKNLLFKYESAIETRFFSTITNHNIFNTLSRKYAIEVDGINYRQRMALNRIDRSIF
jgi:Zn-dependent peptidase ImmA (M78 family)